MIIPKNILKFWGVFFIILAVALGVITLIYRWHRIFPTHEVSEIYSRYAKEEGIDAAFVKDYRVNDSVTVDVTVLEAKDSARWQQMLDDFNIYQMTPKELALYGDDMYKRVRVAIRPSYDYKGLPDSNQDLNDVISISFPQRQICVFHTSGTNGHLKTIYLIVDHSISSSNINFNDYEKNY